MLMLTKKGPTTIVPPAPKLNKKTVFASEDIPATAAVVPLSSGEVPEKDEDSGNTNKKNNGRGGKKRKNTPGAKSKKGPKGVKSDGEKKRRF
jgi:hypothetical protein